MSEEAKLVYLKEKLDEAKKNERSGSWSFIIGLVVAAFGYAILELQPSWLALVLIMCGVGLVVIGIIDSFYLGLRQKIKLMEQLERMAIKTPICPKCGKVMPKGNFEFCPFCGTRIKDLT